MKFSYNWIQSFFIKKLPSSEKLADILTLHSFESSSKNGVLDLDILPNRGSDCFSHIGVAREIATILDIKLQIPPINFIRNGKTENWLYYSLDIEETRNDTNLQKFKIDTICLKSLTKLG